jgi:peptidyl-prolyl cis-trans isomerase C
MSGWACETAPPASTAAAEPAEAPAQEAPQAAPLPKELPAVLARVNDETIQRWEVEAAVREIEILNVHPIPSSERDQFVRAVLDRIIGHHLVVQEARARNLRISDAEVEADVARMRKEFPSDAAFNEALASFRTTPDQLRAQRRLSLEVAQFVRVTIAPTVSVTDAQVQAYYHDNLPRFQEPDTVRASHILIQSQPGATSEQKDASRARAVGILKQLRGGADFAVLARQHSDDPASASDGGNLGVFARGQMDPAFEAAAFALEPGGLSDVVESGFGFHVIKVHERRAAHTAPLDEARGAIRDLLAERLQQERLAAVIAQARAKAAIQVFI